jgi:hypothetical protein
MDRRASKTAYFLNRAPPHSGAGNVMIWRRENRGALPARR